MSTVKANEPEWDEDGLVDHGVRELSIGCMTFYIDETSVSMETDIFPGLDVRQFCSEIVRLYNEAGGKDRL